MGLLDTNYQDQRLTASQKKKIKPAIQGGGYNYLGEQEEVTVPRKWLSDPDHVVAELAYITPREKKVLIDLNMYGSLDGKPNNAPGGLPSLQGDMGDLVGGGGNGGGGGGGGGGRDYSPPSKPTTKPSAPPSKPTTKPSAPPGGGGRDYSPPSKPSTPPTPSTPSGGGDARESYGAGGQYQQTTTPSTPSVSVGGNDNIIDPGFIRALDEQARFQTSLADPDPYVDVPIEERDTITSFLDNYAANVRANPFELGLIGALKTAYQTGQARDMMRGLPGYSFLGSGLRDDATSTGGGGGDVINNIVSQAPYLISGSTPQESMVNQYFANMGNMGQSLSSSLQTSYNNAKNSINNILGITPPSQQFGYSAQPYGLLSSTNVTSNPFNIDYLRRLGLI
jgi:hypothetical protein